MQTEKQLNLKQKLSIVAVLCLLCSLPILWVLKERADKEAEIQAAKVAAENGKKAVAAAMVDQPQPPKGLKKKMVKIVRGSSGTADSAGAFCFAGDSFGYYGLPPGSPGLDAGFVEKWWIDNGSGIVAESGSEAGWSFDSSGGVVVPSSTPAGVYSGYYATEGACTPSPPNEALPGAEIKTFQFEVVCMKVTLLPSGGAWSSIS